MNRALKCREGVEQSAGRLFPNMEATKEKKIDELRVSAWVCFPPYPFNPLILWSWTMLQVLFSVSKPAVTGLRITGNLALHAHSLAGVPCSLLQTLHSATGAGLQKAVSWGTEK